MVAKITKFMMKKFKIKPFFQYAKCNIGIEKFEEPNFEELF